MFGNKLYGKYLLSIKENKSFGGIIFIDFNIYIILPK